MREGEALAAKEKAKAEQAMEREREVDNEPPAMVGLECMRDICTCTVY